MKRDGAVATGSVDPMLDIFTRGKITAVVQNIGEIILQNGVVKVTCGGQTHLQGLHHNAVSAGDGRKRVNDNPGGGPIVSLPSSRQMILTNQRIAVSDGVACHQQMDCQHPVASSGVGQMLHVRAGGIVCDLVDNIGKIVLHNADHHRLVGRIVHGHVHHHGAVGAVSGLIHHRINTRRHERNAVPYHRQQRVTDSAVQLRPHIVEHGQMERDGAVTTGSILPMLHIHAGRIVTLVIQCIGQVVLQHRVIKFGEGGVCDSEHQHIDAVAVERGSERIVIYSGAVNFLIMP